LSQCLLCASSFGAAGMLACDQGTEIPSRVFVLSHAWFGCCRLALSVRTARRNEEGLAFEQRVSELGASNLTIQQLCLTRFSANSNNRLRRGDSSRLLRYCCLGGATMRGYNGHCRS
jgi:hypothetical protein